MITDYKIESFAHPVSDLPDVPNMSASDLKKHFDSNSNELKESLNSLIDFLQAQNEAANVEELKSRIENINNELTERIESEENARQNADDEKADKENGKGLSTNDFTDECKAKLDTLENYDDTDLKKEIENVKLFADSGISTVMRDLSDMQTNLESKADKSECEEKFQNLGGTLEGVYYKTQALEEENEKKGVKCEFVAVGTKVKLERGCVYFIRTNDSSAKLQFLDSSGVLKQDADENDLPESKWALIIASDNLVEFKNKQVYSDIMFVPSTLSISDKAVVSSESDPYIYVQSTSQTSRMSVWKMKM